MILEAIKKQTAQNHHLLEQSNLLYAVTDASLTPDHYVKILRVFYGYFYPLENKIDRISVLKNYLPDYTTRRKAAMIRQDMLSLQAIQQEETLPACDNLPQIQTAAQAFGSLYVLEGSTLGGKIIARNLRKNLGLDEASGASFFHGYGPDTGSKWKTFQQALLQFSLDTGEDIAVIASANDTFHKLNSWINQN